MPTLLPLTLVSLCLSLFATSAFARTIDKKNVRKASYNRQADYSTSSERRASSPATSPEVKFYFGTMIGNNSIVEDGDGTLLGIDTVFKTSREVFFPVGVTRMQGDINQRVNPLVSGTWTVTNFDLGVGYRNWITYKTYVPFGVRLGMYEAEFEGSGLFSGVTMKDYGKMLQPFSGFTTNISRKVSLGYEARVIFAFDQHGDFADAEDESDEDDDESSGNSIASYHAFGLTILL